MVVVGCWHVYLDDDMELEPGTMVYAQVQQPYMNNPLMAQQQQQQQQQPRVTDTNTNTNTNTPADSWIDGWVVRGVCVCVYVCACEWMLRMGLRRFAAGGPEVDAV